VRKNKRIQNRKNYTVGLILFALLVIILLPLQINRQEIRSRAASDISLPTPLVHTQIAQESSNNSTVLSFSLALHGIGSSGDKRNNKDTSLSNKNPLTQQRQVQVYLDTSSGSPILTTTMPVIYDSTSGYFNGKVLFGHDVASGTYKVKVKTAGYLQKDMPDIITLTQHQETVLPLTDLTSGDVNNDNILDSLDYNLFLDCGYGSIEPLSVADPQSAFNRVKCQSNKNAKNVDIDDNGIVDSKDYNLFLREL
jgi:hypothetical protein